MSRDDEREPPDSESPQRAEQEALRDAEEQARKALDALDALRRPPGATPSPPESGPVLRSLPPNPDVARWLSQGMARPSFFPEESTEQSRAFVDELVPSLRPSPSRAQSVAPIAQDSGLYATGTDQEVSSVVLLHTRDTDDDLSHADARAISKPGLISSLLGGDRAGGTDDGAIAALRTLPRRKRRGQVLPLVGPGSELARARLLADLAERTAGSHRALLHTAAAELFARSAQPDHARAEHSAAYAADPSDAEALRRHLRDAITLGDFARALELMWAHVQLDITPEERALILCAIAELQQSQNADVSAAEAALKEARNVHPGSLVAALRLAELGVSSGRQRQAAESLRRGAELWRDPAGRAALLAEAARMLEHCGEAAQAQALFVRAAATTPQAFGPALGAYRTSRAIGESAGAEQAIAALTQAASDPRLQAELARHHARVLQDLLEQPARAMDILSPSTSLLGLRALARAAELAGDPARRLRALQDWARSAGGSERALALIEAARVYAAAGDRDSGEACLREAALAGAPSGLLGLAREELARAAGDRAGLAQAIEAEEGSDSLRAAAKLASDPAQTEHELSLLKRAAAGREGQITAETLLLDAAAEQPDLGELRAALARTAAGLPARERVGAWLAWLDVTGLDVTGLDVSGDDASGDDASGDDGTLASQRNVVLQRLREDGGGAPIALRELGYVAGDAQTIASLWLQEAASSEGDAAAFAATQAGRYLELAGADPAEAYAEALDAVRGYWPACFAAEVAARKHGDLLSLERAHRELAGSVSAGIERAARWTRLALLSAEADPDAAARKLEQAQEDCPSDLLLSDLLVRLSIDGPPGDRALRAQRAAELEPGKDAKRAASLRAAAASEDAGRWDEALASYRGILRDAPQDPLAQHGLAQALQQAGRYDELVAHIEQTLSLARTPTARCAQLETLAEVEATRGEHGRARMALETLLEAQPGNVVALRGLQRHAMQDGDHARLVAAGTQLARVLSGERERAAELRLAVRAQRRLPDASIDELLLSAEARIQHDLWYARSLEALALRAGDRTRFYDAACMVSELLEDPLERASYALRAAEAFEAAAPARAAEELGPALSSAPDHPLATEELGRLLRAAGKPRAAAETFERAATLTRSPKHAATLFYSAAVIFQDELSDRARALHALRKVAELDVLFGDAFARLRTLLSTKTEPSDLLALLERRLAAGADAALSCELHAERARLLLHRGEREAAKNALRAALQADALRPDLLRELAEQCLKDGEHRQASDALIQLARITTDNDALAFAFYELGMIYDQHLPDPRRAEIAFTRVVALAPNDMRPVERLVALWRRGAQLDRAVRALHHLIASDRTADERDHHIVELADTLTAQGDHRTAEQTLEAARKQTPASLPVLRALDELYLRQGDRTARAMHLSRSCHALRTAIEENPADVAAWIGLIALLDARDRGDAAVMTANAARALGHDDPTLLARCGALPGLGAQALSDAVQRRIHVRGVLDALRPFLQASGAELDALLPSEARVDANAIVAQSQVLAAVGALFGTALPQVSASRDTVCIPVSDKPLTLAVNGAAWNQASDAQRFFMATRAVAVARQGLTLLVRAQPERWLLAMHAAKKLLDPKHGVAAVDLEALAELTRELGAALSPATRAQLDALIAPVFAEREWNPRKVAMLALGLGNRIALCVTGNIDAAFEALWLIKGRAPGEVTSSERQSVARSDPQMRALLSFAISEAYLEARREVLRQGAGQEA